MTSLRSMPLMLRSLAVGLGYAAGAEFSYQLLAKAENHAAFWPPAGILLGALLATERRQWWALLLAAAGANAVVDLAHWQPIPMCLAWLAINLSAPVMAAALISWLGGGRAFTFERLRDMAVWCLVVTLVSTPLGAAAGAATVMNSGGYLEKWFSWWVGDLLGVLTLTPLLHGILTSRLWPQPGRALEAVALLGGLGSAAWVVLQLPVNYSVPPALLFLFLMWAAMRFKPLVVSAAATLLTMVTLWITASGQGAFDLGQGPASRLLMAQLFCTIAAILFYVLAAAIAERRSAEAETRESNLRLDQLVRERTAKLEAANQGLRESEAFARQIAEIAPSVLYIYDLEEKRNIWGNRGMFEGLGYSREQLDGMGGDLLGALMHPEEFAEYPSHAAHLLALEDGATAEFEYRMWAADGSWKWLVSRDMIFRRSPEGRATQIIGAALDITERKEAEAALRVSGDSFRQLVEQSPFGVYAVDADFRLVMVSAGAQKVFQTVRPLLNRDFEDVMRVLWPEPFVSEALGHFRHTLATGEPYHSPSMVERRADIEETEAYDWKIERVTLPDGRHGVVCHFYDLSERQRYEEALRESGERLRVFIENAPAAIAMLDKDMRYIAASQRWVDDYGLEGGIIGRSHYEVFPEIPAHWKSIHQRAINGEVLHSDGEQFERMDGRVQWIKWDVLPWRSKGKIGGILIAAEDITARKQMEDALAAAKDAAEAANHAKDKFIATLSHELRNPLTPVLLVAHDMLRDPAITGEMREAWETVKRNVTLEKVLIDDMLDLEKIARGKLSLSCRAVDAHEILRQALDTARSDSEGKNQVLEVRFDATYSYVSADPARLQQIFWNVLNNAVKFTPVGGSISVRTLDSADGRFTVEIADSGLGLTPQELTHLFESFTQGEHADRGGSHIFGGLGLGMAITQSLVERHGGTIRARSEGRHLGATFTIELPALGASADVSGMDSRLPGGNGPTKTAMSAAAAEVLRILLVEDHESTRQTLGRMLTRRGYEVHLAGSVSEALAHARQIPFHFVISDLGLPDGDGCELMPQLRELVGPLLMGIALSGYGMREDIARSQAAGFHTHLTKPVAVESLSNVLDELEKSVGRSHALGG